MPRFAPHPWLAAALAAALAACGATPAPPPHAAGAPRLHRPAAPFSSVRETTPPAPAFSRARQQVGGPFPAPGQCRYRTAADGALLPDPQCTPGATDPQVTQQNVTETICRPGYTAAVRPPVTETDRAKHALMRAYGQTRPNELDHLIPLELGGSSAVQNLWPEPPPSPNPKDRVEDALHALVCSGQLPLATAQRLIATDWTTALAQATATPAPRRAR